MALSAFGPQTALAGKNQSNDEIRAVTCNALKGTGNLGVEFYFTFDPCYEEAGNNKLMLYLASASAGYATVEVVDKGFKQKVVLKANDVVPVELGPGNGQAFSKPVNGGIPPEQVYPGAAVHVTSTVPIVIYAVTRFAYTSDSFMALPVQTLGKDYIVASMADMSWMYGGYSLPSETAIVAAYDNTVVTFTLGGPSVTKTGGGMTPGQTKTFNMNKGDVWVVGNDANSKEGDMSGSIVKATKPVAVISGNQCANVPTVSPWCDFVSEQEIPTALWGRYLQVPKYASRTNGYFMKVFARTPNTKINYNGSYWKTLQKAGGSEGQGYIYQRVDGTGNNVLSLSGDKPISATVFNPGQSDDNVSTDPFQMDIMPIEQYQKNVIFCTPGTKGGINFTRNYLGVIFQLDSTGSMPKDLEFGQSVNGKIKWQPLSAKFGPAFSTKDIFKEQVNGKTYAFKECTLGADGVYALRCSLPFMSYNYGGSDYDSYGHPTSGALTVVTSIPDTIQPRVTYQVDCDGSVGVKTPAVVSDLPNDSTCSNMSSIILVADSSFNYTLDYDPFEAGAASAKNVKFRLTVDDPDADGHALVVFTDRAGNQSCIEVNYKATKLTIEPNFWSFTASSPAKKGEVRTHDFVVKNFGSSDALVARLEFKAGGAGVFEIVPKVNLPFTLGAGQSYPFTVQYTANNDGYITDSIGVGDTCVFKYRTKVEAKTGEPIINVTDVDFGNLVLNSTPVQLPFRVESKGTVKLSVIGQSGVVLDQGNPIPNGMFSTNVPALSAQSPLVLDTNGSTGSAQNYVVTCTPNTLGQYNAKVIFSSDASTIDSICYIKANILTPGLSVNKVDFQRCRINGNKKYTGPYDMAFDNLDNKIETAYISLTNTGTSDLQLTDDAIISGAASKFQMEKVATDFKNLTIKPGETVKYWIKYIPDSPAYDTLAIEFKSNAGASQFFYAYGVGVVPRVKIDSVNFGLLQLVNGSASDNKKFTITNLGAKDWPFYDKLEITDLADATGGIANNGQSGVSGSEFMSFERTELNLPMTMNPGDVSTQFNAWYRPNAVANNTSTLVTTSDAQTEGVSLWNGSASGGVLKYTLAVPDVSVCVGDSILLNVVIANTGDSTLGNQMFATGTFRLKNVNSTEIILPANITTPILCGQTRTVSMWFKPTTAGSNTYTLVCDATPGAPFVTVEDAFTVTGLTYPSKLFVNAVPSLHATISTDGTSNYFSFPVSLDRPLDAANIHSLTVDVKFYNRDLSLRLKDNDQTQAYVQVATGGAANGFSVLAPFDVNGDTTTVHVKLSSVSNSLKGGAGSEMFMLEFQLLLDVTYQEDFRTNGTKVTIMPAKAYSDANFTNSTCAIIDPSTINITASEVCAYSLDHVSIGLGQFQLKGISPNPVGSEGTRIDFGVGFDGPTRIDIIGPNGDVVSTLVNETLKGGYYNLNFVPKNLASGSYLVRMISSGNTFTQKMQVVK